MRDTPLQIEFGIRMNFGVRSDNKVEEATFHPWSHHTCMVDMVQALKSFAYRERSIVQVISE
jgi:uncharacterized protein YcgI (DUF1989 family)